MQNSHKWDIHTQISVYKAITAKAEFFSIEIQVGNTKDVKDKGIQCDLPRMI